MTEAPSWPARVQAMIAQAEAHQDELFYQLALPGWLAELRSLRGGDDLTPETIDDGHLICTQKEHHT